jgi:uncharacterized protein YkwD
MKTPARKETWANRTTEFRFCFAYFPSVFSTVVLVLLLAWAPRALAQQSDQEKQLLQELNTDRKDANLPPLQWDERLAQAARDHSKLMADSNQLGHVLQGEQGVAERLAATGIHYNRSGENVGYDTKFDDLTNAWMHSPPHRENMLNPEYNVVGIGVAKNDDGVYFATQDFAHALPQRTVDQAEDLAAQSFDALRKKAGHDPMERANDPAVHDAACQMAKAQKLDPQLAMKLPGVHLAVVYSDSRPEQLPDSARTAARSKQFTKYTVGACFSGDQSNAPGGIFYVVMTFY